MSLDLLLSRRVDWEDDLPFKAWGDLRLSVSIFDHWLSIEEARATPYMSFQAAVERDALAEYLEGERRFSGFYAELAAQGALIPYDRRTPHVLPPNSGRLARIIRDSLRERRLMDLIFPAVPVRAIGGHDRTDHLLPANEQLKKILAAMAIRHGLFVLPN